MCLDELNYIIENKLINDDVLKKIEEYADNTNDGEFLRKVGLLFRCGVKGFPKNYNKSFKYCLKAAEIGNTDAMNLVAYAYSIGLGCNKNEKFSFKWNLKGAKLNNTKCINSLAEAYLSGIGVRVDRNKAIIWYKKGAELGDGTCIRALIRYFKIDYFNDGNVGF